MFVSDCYKANFIKHFPKIISLKQIKNKVLINYCENAAYYNTTQSLSVKKLKKKNKHVKKNITYK